MQLNFRGFLFYDYFSIDMKIHFSQSYTKTKYEKIIFFRLCFLKNMEKNIRERK